MPSRSRWFIAVVLLSLGSLAGIAAALTPDDGNRSIAVGVSSTLLTAGVVDLFGLLERRRHAVPIEKAAARRVGELYRTVLQILNATFPNLNEQPGETYAVKLIAHPEVSVSLTDVMPNLHPPRSRSDHVRLQHRDLRRLIDELLTFLSAGALDGDLEGLDEKLRNAWVLRVATLDPPPGIAPGYVINDVLKNEGVALLNELKPHFDRARKVVGAGWRYGDGSP